MTLKELNSISCSIYPPSTSSLHCVFYIILNYIRGLFDNSVIFLNFLRSNLKGNTVVLNQNLLGQFCPQHNQLNYHLPPHATYYPNFAQLDFFLFSNLKIWQLLAQSMDCWTKLTFFSYQEAVCFKWLSNSNNNEQLNQYLAVVLQKFLVDSCNYI